MRCATGVCRRREAERRAALVAAQPSTMRCALPISFTVDACRRRPISSDAWPAQARAQVPSIRMPSLKAANTVYHSMDAGAPPVRAA